MNNIFLFYGEDNYRSTQKLRFWRQEFVKKYGEEATEIIEGKDLNPPQFTTNIGTLPFLSEKRLIIVKNFLENGSPEDQKKVAEHLEKTTEQCIIIFFETEPPDKRTSLFQKLSKTGQVEEFKALSPQEITKWIIEKSKKENLQISPKTANYLAEHAGADLWTISNELEKLKTYANGQEITTAMIDEICPPSLSASIFKLTDAVAQKNKKQSLKTFEILRESGEDLGKVFFMLVRHFRILLQVNDLISKGENPFSITKKLQQHPYVIQKTSEQSKNFNEAKLEKIYKELLQIDIKIKSGLIKSFKGDNREFELAIEKLIIDCCK